MERNREHEKSLDPLENLTDDQIAEIVESNDALDREEKRLLKEEREDRERLTREKRNNGLMMKILKKSPLEIINRLLFFFFIGSFLFSFAFVYKANSSWFILYLISAFSCILYTPNRKALKELLAAWPNIEDIIRKRNFRK